MPRSETRKIAMLAYDNAQVLDIVGPLEVFSRASRLLVEEGRADHELYTVELISDKAGPIVTSSGISLVAARSFDEVNGGIDTLFITGGIGFRDAAADTDLLNWIQREYKHVRRLASVCTGSFILAAAGILEGQRVATHWAYCDELASESDGIEVDRTAVFVSNGRLYTSAGVTTGMDMSLAMVEEDWGAPIALRVAKQLVLYQKRVGDERQVSRQLTAQLEEQGRASKLLEWILGNLDQDLSVKKLAERMSVSERQLSRVFVQETGLTPGKYVDQIRVEAAQRRLQNGRLTIQQVAKLCGFSNDESMRRTFHRIVGASPTSYRT